MENIRLKVIGEDMLLQDVIQDIHQYHEVYKIGIPLFHRQIHFGFQSAYASKQWRLLYIKDQWRQHTDFPCNSYCFAFLHYEEAREYIEKQRGPENAVIWRCYTSQSPLRVLIRTTTQDMFYWRYIWEKHNQLYFKPFVDYSQEIFYKDLSMENDNTVGCFDLLPVQMVYFHTQR